MQGNFSAAKEVDRTILEDGSIYVVLDLRAGSIIPNPPFAAYKLTGQENYSFIGGGSSRTAAKEALSQYFERQNLRKKKENQ